MQKKYFLIILPTLAITSWLTIYRLRPKVWVTADQAILNSVVVTLLIGCLCSFFVNFFIPFPKKGRTSFLSAVYSALAYLLFSVTNTVLAEYIYYSTAESKLFSVLLLCILDLPASLILGLNVAIFGLLGDKLRNRVFQKGYP